MLGVPTVSSTTIFCNQMCRFVFLTLDPWPGRLVWVWDSTPEESLLNFYSPHVIMGPAHSTSAPPTSLDVCGFFNSIVVRLPFNSISDGSELWLFYILAVILMWLCKEASHGCLYHLLDWMSDSVFFEKKVFCVLV